jgi:hypothetical protein
MNGYIAARYDGELYDIQQHLSHFRSFGITQKSVRERLTLIAVPPKAGGGYGVYPDTARNALRIRGDKRAGEALPWAEWAQEFANRMPPEIAAALVKAGPADSTGSIKDSKWKERLIDRFGKRWKTVRYILNEMGTIRVHPTPAGGGGVVGGSGGGGGGHSGKGGPQPGGDAKILSGIRKLVSGAFKATSVKSKGGVPDWRWTDESEVEEGAAAAWSAVDPQHLNGVVLLNREFPAFIELKRFWVEQYPDHLADEVVHVIEEVYGEVMVARIAHSEELRTDPRWGSSKVDGELRSTGALTMAALGLLSEDALISSRLAGKLGAKVTKKTTAAA